ncbi:MAG: T9SS type A sorting domain-containing protein, partial [Chitinophagales bacterium]
EKGHSIQLEIYNTTGQQIFTRELNPEQNVFAISMPEIATGMYIVKIIFGEYQAQQKLIIE